MNSPRTYLSMEYDGITFLLFDSAGSEDEEITKANDTTYVVITSELYSLSNGLRVGMKKDEAKDLSFDDFFDDQHQYSTLLFEPAEFMRFSDYPSVWNAVEETDGGIHAFELFFDDSEILRVIILCR